MVSIKLISKSIDDAIGKCKPKFATMHTPKQIARYFHLNYEGIVNKSLVNNDDYVESDNLLKFTDPNNEDCNIFISEELFDKKTGNLKNSDWYHDEYLEYPEDYTDLSDEDVKRIIQEEGYPLKQFIQDYKDIPSNIQSSVEEVVFSSEEDYTATGRWLSTSNGKGTVLLYSDALDVVGFRPNIESNPRTVLYHEMGHAIAHKLGYEAEYGAFFDTDANYLAESKDYMEGRRRDRKLTGDFYATEYGVSSKSKVEEQADVTMAMLLKACSDNDSNYNLYRIALASAYEDDYTQENHISIDDFLARYPNRVSALNKYLNLDL